MAVLDDVKYAKGVLDRAVERIGQVIRHDSESVVAAVAPAARSCRSATGASLPRSGRKPSTPFDGVLPLARPRR
jgi:hypothetical protein